ncbi:unnamed protein product [Rodentolepis nana]|uniref:YccF domain-containing protein n=1 Tax=Rodentolepis nana TaxID=102285 RepID=A0A0R3TGD8_RODNA|nr:unnamed protein product [Rodentolepis nana]
MDGKFCLGLFYSFLWAILVVFIAWPFAVILAVVYIVLIPFASCIENIEPSLDGMFKYFKLPLVWARKAMEMTPIYNCNFS